MTDEGGTTRDEELPTWPGSLVRHVRWTRRWARMARPMVSGETKEGEVEEQPDERHRGRDGAEGATSSASTTTPSSGHVRD
jgi:hypothetical protein